MTTPIAAVKSGFRKYVRFGGRATRPEFWWWMLFIVIASIVLGIIDRIIGRAIGAEDFTLLGSLFGLATLLPSLAVASRRLHDIGKSGWWQLLWYAIWMLAWVIVGVFVFALALSFAIAGDLDVFARGDSVATTLVVILAVIAGAVVMLGVIVWAIIWLARQGEPGENRYGPDPRAASDAGTALPEQDDRYTDYPRSD